MAIKNRFIAKMMLEEIISCPAAAVVMTLACTACTSEAAKQTTGAVQQTEKETTSTAQPGSEQHETKIVWVREDPTETGVIDLYLHTLLRRRRHERGGEGSDSC